MPSPSLKRALVVLLTSALVACGGGASAPGAGGGPQPSANLFLQGSITASQAGQIVVNGVQVSTAGATIHVEGVEKTEAELHHGMVVKVKAHGAGREAEGLEIEFEDAAKGTVGAKDDTSLHVSGQLVHVDDSTEFDDPVGRLGSISLSDRVRISGVPDDRGGLRATRVEHTSDVSHELELKGWVSGLGSTGFTLKLSPDSAAADTYAVTLAAGVVLPAGVVDGAFVEVRSEQPAAANAITASGVVLEDGLPGQAEQETEVEGIVSSGTAAAFVVDGTSVTTSATTVWDGGVVADFAVGAKVEAEGVLDASGVLAAHKVSFRGNARLFGRVAGKAGAGTATTFTVNGVAVQGDMGTDWRTSGDALADGDWVELRGQAARSGTGLTASRVEAKGAGNARPVIQGSVTAFDPVGGTVTILGQTIGAGSEFHDHPDTSGVDGPAIGSTQFFAALTAGLSVVKATGPNGADWTAGPSGPARSLELEGER